MKENERVTCEEALRRLDEYLDRELQPGEMERIREHLEACEDCSHERQFEESVCAEIRAKLDRLAMPADLRIKVFERLKGSTGAPPTKR